MKAWDDTWKDEVRRKRWLEPDSFITSLLPLIKKERISKVLDLGFGIGRHSILFAQNGYDVYGIETSPSGIEFTKEEAKKEKVRLELIQGGMSYLPFKDDSLDLIIAWNVIYHGTRSIVDKTVNEIRRCLKPEKYFLSTLISTKHVQFGQGKELEENTFRISSDPEKSHPHHYFDFNELKQVLSNFTLIKCEDREQYGPKNFHWHILAKLDKMGSK
jgi:SAM-dependent methyltransferase